MGKTFLSVFLLAGALIVSGRAASIKSVEQLTAGGGYSSPSWAPDGAKFFAQNSAAGIMLYDFSGKNGKALKPDETNLVKPSWSFDGNSIAAENLKDQSIMLFDLISGKARTLEESNTYTKNLQPMTRVYGPCFAPDNDNIFFFYWRLNHGQTESYLRQYTLSAGGWDKIAEMIPDRRNYGNIAVSPKGGTLVFMRDLLKDVHTLYAVDTETGKKKLLFEELKGKTPVWSPDGKYIYTGAELLNPAEKTCVKACPESAGFSWSADGKKLFGAEKEKEGSLFIFDIESGKKQDLPVSGFKVAGVSFTGDGKKAVCVDEKGGNLFLLTIE